MIDTGSGSVRAALAGSVSDIEIDTGSGSVTLVLPSSYGATVDLESGSGGIDLDFPVEVRRAQKDHGREIGGASRREREQISGVAVSLKKNDRS